MTSNFIDITRQIIEDSILDFVKINHKFTNTNLRNEVINLTLLEILKSSTNVKNNSTSNAVRLNVEYLEKTINDFNVAAMKIAPDDYKKEQADFMVDAVYANLKIRNCWDYLRDYFLKEHEVDISKKYNINFIDYSVILKAIPNEKKLDIIIETDRLNDLGANKFKEKKFLEAIEYFNSALEVYPDNDDAYINLGICFLKMQEFDKAIEYSMKAIQINPSAPESYRTIGDVYYASSDWLQVVKWYRKSASLGDISTCNWLINNGYEL